MQRLVLLFFLFQALRPCAQSIVWVSPCSNKTFCLNPGSCTMGDVLIAEEAVTTCGNPKVNYSYRIDLYSDGSIDIQSPADTVTGPFPKGTHTISWRASDNCGNINPGCTYQFVIKDCTPPNLLCLNGLTQNLELPQCEATFDVEDFIINYSDNCTPKANIQLGIRRAGSGSGFPTDTSLTFGLCEQGFHTLQIWVKDENNLTNQCNSYVLVQDNANICVCDLDANIMLEGCVHSADSSKLENYILSAQLEGVPLQGQPFTQPLVKSMADSCFSEAFSALPLNGNYQGVVRVQRVGDPLLGVSTFDLVQINKHILAQQPLKNFYQVMAADVNQSKSVTTLDIVEIRKLILGIYDTFPNVPSWRFIRPLTDPSNLLSHDLVRDTYQFAINNLQTDATVQNLHFVGVKSGDANSNASFTQGPEDRFSGAPLVLETADVPLKKGETRWIPVAASEPVLLDGWQLALQTDADLLKITNVRGVPAEYVALTAGSTNLRISWMDASPALYGPDQPLFWILVEAKSNTRLSESLALQTARLSAEAYPAASGQIRRLQLQVGDNRPQETRFASPRPNPSADDVTFDMYLVAAGWVELEVFDVSGRRAYHSRLFFDAGAHTLNVPAGVLPKTGVWMYRISAGGYSEAGRLVRM